MAVPTKAVFEKHVHAEPCVAWNANVLADLYSNEDFVATSNRLHEMAFEAGMDDLPVMDGHATIRSAKMDRVTQFTIYFELFFLGPREFMSPAFFKIELDEFQGKAGLATYGCGTRGRNGELFMGESRLCLFPDTDSDWAVLCSCRFGDTGLRRWLSN